MPRYLVTGVEETGVLLVLNPMRVTPESRASFGIYPNKQAALAFYNSELASQPYSEEVPSGYSGDALTYRKVFKKGGPLEWMNPLSESEMKSPSGLGHGFHEIVVGFTEQSRVELPNES